MVERLLPAEDPVLENVLKWTVERDAKDVRRLLEWFLKHVPAGNEKPFFNVCGLLTELKLPLTNLTTCTEECSHDRCCRSCRWRKSSHG